MPKLNKKNEAVVAKIREQLDNPTAPVVVVTANADAEQCNPGLAAAVEQKQKKATVKKPSAEQLGVSAVVGNRGKVRSENPAPQQPKSTIAPEIMHKGTREVLQSWCDYAAAEGKITAEARKYFSRRGRIGHAKVGSLVLNIASGQEAKVLEQFEGSSTKVRVGDKVTTWAPGTEIEVVPASETKENAPAPKIEAKEAPASVSDAPTKAKREFKARGDGWNGFSGSALGRWMGSQGWNREQAWKAFQALAIDGVQEKSIPTLLKAGKDGLRVPEVSPDLATKLNVAGGLMTEPTEVKIVKKSKSK